MAGKKKVRKNKKKSEAFQKQNLFILILLIIVFLITIGVYYGLGIPEKTKKEVFTEVIFENGDVIEVEVAKTLRELEKGLMYRESLDENKGMLFIFWQEEELDFWMLNMKFPIDMIFINKNMTIVNVVKNAQPCPKEPCDIYKSVRPAIYVIEVNAGYASEHGVVEGQKIEFE